MGITCGRRGRVARVGPDYNGSFGDAWVSSISQWNDTVLYTRWVEVDVSRRGQGLRYVEVCWCCGPRWRASAKTHPELDGNTRYERDILERLGGSGRSELDDERTDA